MLDALPCNVPVERVVLGSILSDEDLFHQARPALTQDAFSIEKHRRIWRRAAALYDAGQRADCVTVGTALHDTGELESIGGLTYLIGLNEGVPQFADVSAYIGILKNEELRRQIITAADSLIKRAESREDPQAILNSLGNLSVDLAPPEIGLGLVSVRQVIDRVGLEQILAPRISRGVPFPWPWMSNATCGMLPGELWVLAAHTSAGKTSAAIQAAVHVARTQSKPVAVFSLEMGEVSILQRAIWQVSRVDSEKAKRGRLTSDERRRAVDAANGLAELPLHFDDGSFSVMEIHARLRRLRSSGPLGLIVVDYLQLLQDGGRHGTRAEAVGANARMLKLMANEFECPGLLLSQFSRESAKTRGNESPRRPELYDLKESGDIENHASGVWLVHRPDLTDAEQTTVEFILAKQRDGRRNILREYWFFPRCQRFDEKGGE